MARVPAAETVHAGATARGVGMSAASMSSIGYPTLFVGVLLGSLLPLVPTGALVGAAAAVAMTTSQLTLPLVMLVAACGAVLGDLGLYTVARMGSGVLLHWFRRSQRSERLAAARIRFGRYGWQLVIVGRLLPAGRVPVLLAAGAVGCPSRRMGPATVVACLLWSVLYGLLGVLSGGVFGSTLVATLVATGLVLLVTLVASLIGRWRKHRRARQPETTVSASR